jgi:NADPH-dependent 2,4-dienoyl-CoA reductase/sulfur reductase-like enzyme/thioesterase domain-containing protein
MNITKSLMGRRQFLIAAGVTSGSALAFNKLAGIVDPVLETGVANAADKSGAAEKGTAFKYNNLLSPLMIGDKIVKNRMIHTVGSPPHFLQGPENFPSNVTRIFYSNVAKGAAIVLCPTVLGSGQGAPQVSKKEGFGDSIHMSDYDSTDPGVQNYIAQIIEGVHSMGSLVLGGSIGGSDVVERAKDLQEQGVDVVTMGTRDFKDKNAIRAAMDQIQSVKKATNLIIAMYLTIQHPLLRLETSDSVTRNCPTLDEAISVAKSFDGLVDIFQFRPAAAMGMHPTGWNQEKGKPEAIYLAKAIRDAGIKMLLAPNAGFQDLDENEEFIASGACDMITMSRAWHADPEYGKKAYEGRGEDVVPCLLCNRCHGPGFTGPWYAACSVNPKIGLESTVSAIAPPGKSRKVAIIGGGPAGMKAAITAAERGHKVTLYEKSDSLGGLLKHADYSSYKWPLKKYKDYLINQVKKTGVEVVLKTEATPEIIRAKGYDAVLAAIGADVIVTRMPGYDSKNVYDLMAVYGREKELGKNVVVIGGGEFGVETGMYLAKAGHRVTMLASEKELLRVERVHYPEYIVDTYEHLDNFYYILEVVPKSISEGKVTYIDAGGNEKSIQTDSVVLYGGLRQKKTDALKFAGSARNAFLAIGECGGKGGNILNVTRSAFYAASQI